MARSCFLSTNRCRKADRKTKRSSKQRFKDSIQRNTAGNWLILALHTTRFGHLMDGDGEVFLPFFMEELMRRVVDSVLVFLLVLFRI